MNSSSPSPSRVVVWTIASVVAFVFLILGGVGLAAGCKVYNRYQARQDAANRVKVTHINIRNAQQQAKVQYAEIAATKAQAKKRFAESIGLRKAQHEIQKSLTPLYIQHEAIQAQLKMAGAPNHTIIWAPAGANGVPVVTDPLAESRFSRQQGGG